MTKYCPSCGEPAVAARGPEDAEILIIGEFPGENEIEQGRPFCGPIGKVLRTELRIAGIEMNLCRISNLWLHAPNGNDDCYKAGMDMILDEAKGRKAILLVGSECANVFLGVGVMEVCGLQVESSLLSCDTIFAMPNPAVVFQPNRGIGEIRLALKKFAKVCEKKGLLEDE